MMKTCFDDIIMTFSAGGDRIMLPLVILLALLGGCQNKKVLDESEYVTGNTADQLSRAQSLIDRSNTKEALIQLYAINNESLTKQQALWVRDEIVTIYNYDRNYEKLIAYLDSREHLNRSSGEIRKDLYEKAEAYHHLSYNYWAKKLGMGSPYRRSKAAFNAKKYYTKFLNRYPHDPRCENIRNELIGLDIYIERYNKELKQYQDYRKKNQDSELSDSK